MRQNNSMLKGMIKKRRIESHNKQSNVYKVTNILHHVIFAEILYKHSTKIIEGIRVVMFSRESASFALI